VKKIIFILTFFLSIGCSSEDQAPVVLLSYTYNTPELEMIQLINDYRVSNSLSPVYDIQHISALCEQSNNYMITYNQVKHYYFQDRVDNLQRVGYTRVSAIVCMNYNTNQSALNAIENSECTRKILAGDFKDFGVSIRTNENGKKFYTLTFTK
jgi:uncharacterized protein YkwD